MSTLERLLPVAASATILCLTPSPVGASSATVRQPINQDPGSGKWIDGEALMTDQRVFIPSAQATGNSHDIFTVSDMAILNAVRRAVVDDPIDYSDLFDYDDD